jgi:hypothetical protein
MTQGRDRALPHRTSAGFQRTDPGRRQPPLTKALSRLQVFRRRCRGRLTADAAAGDARLEQRVDELDVPDGAFNGLRDDDIDDVLTGRRLKGPIDAE